jgi:hypothetical protein
MPSISVCTDMQAPEFYLTCRPGHLAQQMLKFCMRDQCAAGPDSARRWKNDCLAGGCRRSSLCSTAWSGLVSLSSSCSGSPSQPSDTIVSFATVLYGIQYAFTRHGRYRTSSMHSPTQSVLSILYRSLTATATDLQLAWHGYSRRTVACWSAIKSSSCKRPDGIPVVGIERRENQGPSYLPRTMSRELSKAWAQHVGPARRQLSRPLSSKPHAGIRPCMG